MKAPVPSGFGATDASCAAYRSNMDHGWAWAAADSFKPAGAGSSSGHPPASAASGRLARSPH
eukprot:7178874-Pyramimonas_sp.AAC.1